MAEEKKSKLVPINSLDLKGEIIKEMIFLDVADGEKTFIIFESGKILVMPVYCKCPVQFGLVENLSEDFDIFLSLINQEKDKLKEMARRIEELKKC